MKHALLIALLLAANPAQANERLLVVSIKPVHSLVETLVAGTDIHAKLLVGGTASLHSMSLKPSQLDMIGKADAVIFISETLESFLTPILRQHPQMKAIALENADRLTRYPPRRGDGHDDDHTGSTDMHVWASPTNAMAMAAMLVNELSAIYPERAVIIAANAKNLQASLVQLDRRLEQRMRPLKGKPFAVFHDAAQYFDRRYGLNYLGAFTLHPERGLSAGHVRELRARLVDKKAVCVFSEPGFDTRVIQNLTATTGIHTAVLDAEGLTIPPGAAMYETLLEAIASAMESCLNS